MKKLYLTLLIFILIRHVGFAQQRDTLAWCPSGASWIYEQEGMFGYFYFLQMRYESDTSILGINNCKLLNLYKSSFFQNSFSDPVFFEGVDTLGFEIFHEANDTVYWLKDSAFVFLYDFGADNGDVWEVPFSNKDLGSFCPFTNFLIQDSLQITHRSWTSIYGFSVEVLNNSSYHGIWGWDYIINKIGGLHGFLPNPSYYADTCGYNDNFPFWGTLVCYRDDLRGQFFNDDLSCNQIFLYQERVNEPPEKVIVLPNPASESIWVQSSFSHANYRILDINGRSLISGVLHDSNIFISTLRNGMYFIELSQDNRYALAKFVKQ